MIYHDGGNESEALHSFSADFEEGIIHVLIGPSGCGKTTLLYLLAGLIQPTSGCINFTEDRSQQHIGLMLQNYGLFSWKTVWKNITLGMEIARLPRSIVEQRGENMLRQMGLEEVRNAYPSQLSGGQQQRAALARIWAMEPNLLLMDEPFSALDALKREELQDWFLKIWQEKRMTCILVTHSIEEAVLLGHKILIMTPTPGKLRTCLEFPAHHDGRSRENRSFYEDCSNVRMLLKQGGA